MDILRDIIMGIFAFLYATHLRSSRRGWPCLQPYYAAWHSPLKLQVSAHRLCARRAQRPRMRAQSANSVGFTYFPKTFFTSPTFRSTLPPTFSAVPRSCKSWFPIALPVFSLTLPTASFAVPSILSCVLESITLDSHFRSRAVFLSSSSSDWSLANNNRHLR